MKKILSVALGCAMLTGCGVGTTDATQQTSATQSASTTSNDLLGSAANSLVSSLGSNSSLSSIISSFTGGVTTTKSTITGTWKYNRPCVQFESESLLAQAGGTTVATNLENKIATYYEKAGIKAGVSTLVLNSNNTFSFTMSGKTASGTYSFDSSNKTITFVTQAGISVMSYVSISGNNMGLTFDANKLLTFVQSAGTKYPSLSTISTLASSFSGVKLGFQYAR